MRLLVLLCLMCCGGCLVTAKGLVGTSTPNSSAASSTYVRVTTIDPIRPDFHLYEKLMKNLTSTLVKKSLPAMYRIMENVNVSSNCLSSLVKYAIALKQIKVWAVKMFDSTAKVPSGVMSGSLTEFGAFDECLNILVTDKRGEEDFRGKYCSVEIIPRLGPRPKNISLLPKKRTAFNDSIMAELRSVIFAFYQMTLRFGVCVPSTCDKEDIKALGTQVVKPLNFGVRVSSCQVKEAIRVEPVHVIMICIIAVLLLLLCSGSYLDWRLSKITPDERKHYLLSLGQKSLLTFSVQANSQKLFSADSRTGEMKCLHGIRALSMTWVILGHTYIWVIFQGLSQSIEARHWLDDIEFEVVLNGWLSVSSFIFLSGLLTTYTTLKFMNSTGGRLNVFLYVLRRFLRLYPSLLLVLGCIFFLPWISSGPFWEDLPGVEVERCRHYWWSNLLFVNNFIAVDKMCMQHSWYISTDMQLHIIALVILLPLYRSSFAGLIIAVGLTIGSFLAIGMITYVNNYDPTILLSSANFVLIQKIVKDVHVKAYTYLGPYCIGVLTAYLLLKYPKINITSMTKCMGWFLTILLGMTSVYGTHAWNSGHHPPAEVTATFAALHRTTFVLALAWMSFMCITGNAGFLSGILKFRPFVLMSRLTFMTYLVQGPVIWTRYGSIKERMFFSHYNMLYEYMGNIILSLSIAFAAHILVEAPFSNLERLLLSTFVKLPPEKKNNLCQVQINANNIAPIITTDMKEKVQRL